MLVSSLFSLLFFSFCLFSSVSSQKNNTAITCLIEPVKIPVPGASVLFPHGLYAEWMSNFNAAPEGSDFVLCNYMCGNDCTKNCLINGKDLTGLGCPVVWGGLESPFNSTDYQKAPDTQMYPIHGSAMVAMYNLGYTMEPELVLSGEVLSQIFSCDITSWRDPQIIALNSGPDQLCPQGDVNSTTCLIPNTKILVFAQPGVSIYSEMWARAMAVFNSNWTTLYGPPRTVWPSTLATKCGMPTPIPSLSSAIAQRNSIVYAIYNQYLSSATGRYARMVNKDGYIVGANSTYAKAAINNAVWDPEKFTADLFNLPGPDSWPIGYFYYMALRKNSTDCGGVRGAIDWLVWSTTNQRAIVRTEEQGYVPLPSNLSEQVRARMKTDVYCHGILAYISFQIHVGVLLPQSGTADPVGVQVWKEMIQFGIDKFNAGRLISPQSGVQGIRGWRIRLTIANSRNDQASALLETNDLMNHAVKAVIGEFSDLLTNTVQVVFAGVSTCQLSPVTQYDRPPTLLDSSQLVRMRQSATSQSSVIVSTMKRLGWDTATLILTTSNELSVAMAGKIFQATSQNNSMNIDRVALADTKDELLIEGELQKVKESGVRLMICALPNQDLEFILEIGERAGLVGKGYTWFFVLLEDPIDEQPNLGSSFNEKLEGSFYFSMVSGRENEKYQELLNEILNLDSQTYPTLIEEVKNNQKLDETMISLYDSIIALGTGLETIIKPKTDFETEEHDFKELCSVIRGQVKFDGLRGDDLGFDQEGDGMIDFKVWNYQKQNSNAREESNNQEIKMGWVQTGVYKTNEGKLTLQSNTVLSGGSLERPPEDYVEPQDEVVKFEIGDPLPIAGIVFTVVGELVVIYFFIEITHFQERKVLKASSLFFLRLVLLGAAIGFVGNLLIVLPSTDVRCRAYTWLCWIGFTLVFGGLYSKTYRIFKIFSNTGLDLLDLSDLKLLRTILALFSPNAILLILWQSIDTPYVTDSGDYYEDGKSAQKCTSDHETVWVVLYLIPFFGLVLGLSMISFRIRNLESKFNESKHLALAIYHFTFCFVVSIGLSIALSSFLEFQSAIRFFGIWFGEIGLLSILFIPKIWMCYKDPAGSNTISINSIKTQTNQSVKTTTTKSQSLDTTFTD